MQPCALRSRLLFASLFESLVSLGRVCAKYISVDTAMSGKKVETMAETQSTEDTRDVVIVGGGPAGLSAALVLGRCRRSVLLCDGNQPRNAASPALWGFLTRDGVDPRELRRMGRVELSHYPSVEARDITVNNVTPVEHGFVTTLADGLVIRSHFLLLATGVVDEIPSIEGIEALYGVSVHHCPYCNGWEERNQAIAIYGRGKNGRGLALELTAWSEDIILCTDGPGELDEDDRAVLAGMGIAVREEPIARLEGSDGRLKRIVFETGDALPRTAMFFSTGEHQRSDLPKRLGMAFCADGSVDVNDHEATNLPGAFVAGDASRRAQSAILATAEGASAAYAINSALIKRSMRQRLSGR